MLPKKPKPIKVNIKEPTPSAADRLYAKHQAIRKAKGLPDPSEYKKKLSEQLYKKARFVSGPAKKPFKSNTVASPVNEDSYEPIESHATLTRKAQIVKDAFKSKKDKQNAKDEASDKFQSEPELSSAIHKT